MRVHLATKRRSGAFFTWLGPVVGPALVAERAAEERLEALERLWREPDRIVGRGGEARGGVEQDQLRTASRMLGDEAQQERPSVGHAHQHGTARARRIEHRAKVLDPVLGERAAVRGALVGETRA